MNFLKQLFAKPSAHVLAQQALDDHMRESLAAQQTLDSARADVQYHTDCIARLQRFLASGGPEVV